MSMKHDTSSIVSCARTALVQSLWLLGMGFSTAGGILLIVWLKPALPVRILAVAVPVVCGVAYAFRLLRDLARLDELQLRIQLEAAATACLGMFLVTIIYPVLQIAGFIGPPRADYFLFLLVGLLLVGYLNATRRYR
jgi:hypothetical protein